ncbi:MAG: guanylate kinase [Burkholderiales bacterium]|nr:MAG: guanylate kinase [Burkholderiales bacterium]
MTQIPGSLLVISAPSGAGKTSLVRELLAACPSFRLSVSFTTRAPRPGEVDGQHYLFVDRAGFERRRTEGEFLEWAEVHGNLYGTSRRWVAEQLAGGADLLLEIDYQGAAQIRSAFPDAVTVFVLPPSREALAERLRTRDQDSDEVIQRRLAAASEEMTHAAEFEYVIVNQEFAVASLELVSIARAARLRTHKQRARKAALFGRLGVR